MCWSGAVSLTCELFSRQFGYGRRGVYNTFNRLISRIHDRARYTANTYEYIRIFASLLQIIYARHTTMYVYSLRNRRLMSRWQRRVLLSRWLRELTEKALQETPKFQKKKWENRPKERTKEKRRMHLTASERPRKASP